MALEGRTLRLCHGDINLKALDSPAIPVFGDFACSIVLNAFGTPSSLQQHTVECLRA